MIKEMPSTGIAWDHLKKDMIERGAGIKLKGMRGQYKSQRQQWQKFALVHAAPPEKASYYESSCIKTIH